MVLGTSFLWYPYFLVGIYLDKKNCNLKPLTVHTFPQKKLEKKFLSKMSPIEELSCRDIFYFLKIVKITCTDGKSRAAPPLKNLINM